ERMEPELRAPPSGSPAPDGTSARADGLSRASGSEQPDTLLGDPSVRAAAIASRDAVPLRMWPEQHVPEAAFVDHDCVATDDRVATLTLLRVRVEGPLARVELLHGAGNIVEGPRSNNVICASLPDLPGRAPCLRL